MDLVAELLPSMRRVPSAESDLRELGLLWAMIEASSVIGCPQHAQTILTTLSETRDRSSSLQHKLARQLAHEGRAELAGELGSAAQCGIDILVRNLFERTADVGFLATDAVLGRFCAADADAQAAVRLALQRRLAEYRDKYTVYDDIAVQAADGRVLLRLDETRALAACNDPLLAQALARTGYVEQDARSPLAADDAPVLLYAHRIEQPAGRVLGVLVLRLRLADELARIFADLSQGPRQPALLMLDAQDRGVASYDTAHVPLGALMRVPAAAQGGSRLSLLNFAASEYLAVLCPTRGYQGDLGPHWKGLWPWCRWPGPCAPVRTMPAYRKAWPWTTTRCAACSLRQTRSTAISDAWSGTGACWPMPMPTPAGRSGS